MKTIGKVTQSKKGQSVATKWILVQPPPLKSLLSSLNKRWMVVIVAISEFQAWWNVKVEEVNIFGTCRCIRKLRDILTPTGRICCQLLNVLIVSHKVTQVSRYRYVCTVTPRHVVPSIFLEINPKICILYQTYSQLEDTTYFV